MLRVKLLGQFTVEMEGRPVAFNSRPAQSLLAYLLLNPAPTHRREKLAGVLWPDSDEKNALNNLRHALWRLRKVLPKADLHASRMEIGWAVDTQMAVDVHRLQASLPANGTDQTEPLQDVLGVYAGDLLPGFYEDWVSLERERLRAVFEERIQHLLDLLTRAGDWSALRTWAETWLAQGQIPEPAYRSLILAHGGMGDIPGAQAAYQRCVEALDRELGVPPSAETTALLEQIRQGKLITPATPNATERQPETSRITRPTVPASTHSNLPEPATPFVGRQQEASALARLLDDPQQRLVTVLGLGGMGKTRLTLAVADEQSETFPDGAHFVGLAGVSDPDGIPGAIAAVLGYPFQDDRRSPRQQLLDYLRPRNLLLVLDNFEHLLAGAELLQEILETARDVHLLVTSREQLRLSGETVFRLGGMELGDGDGRWTADGTGGPESATSPAAALFIASARRVRLRFLPDEEDRQAIEQICRLVAGMPLGIVLAAGWMDVLPPQEIAAEIARDLDFLQAERVDMPDRQRSMRAILAQTWRNLSPVERSVMEKLSVFRGGISRPAAATVAGCSLRTLTVLVQKALLRRDKHNRFHMHELLRQFAEEQRETAGQLDAARSAHSDYFLAFLSQREADLQGRRQQEAHQEISQDWANIRAGWRWAAKVGDAAAIGEALEAYALFCEQPGRWSTAQVELDRAVTSLASHQEPEALIVQARALAWLGYYLYQAQEPDEAQAAMENSLHILSNENLAGIDARDAKAFVLLYQHGGIMISRERTQVQEAARESLSLWQQTGNHWWEARTLCMLGNMEFFNGETKRARQHVERALDIFRECQDPSGIIFSLERLSFFAEHQGRFDECLQLAQEALVLAEDAAFSCYSATNRYCWALISTGQFERAFIEFERLVTEQLQLGVKDVVLGFKGILRARINLHLGRTQRARSLADGVVDHFRESYGWEHPYFVWATGRAALAEGKIEEAYQLLQKAVRFQETVGNHNLFPLSGALVDAAYPAYHAGEMAEARRSLQEGLRMSFQIGAYRHVIQGLPVAALLLAEDGPTERVADLYAYALTFPYLANSYWYQDVALEKLAETVSEMPAEVRDAAETRGRLRSLESTATELLTWLEENPAHP